MTLQDVITEFYETTLDTLHQMKLYREKTGSETKVTVKLMNRDGHTQDTIPGLITKDRKICYLPTMQRPIINPVIWTEKGKRFVYVSAGSHTNDWTNIVFDVAEHVKGKIKARWLAGRNWVTMEIQEATGSIDWTLFDHDYSINWAQMTNEIMSGNIMSAITEYRSSKIMLMLIAAVLFGMVLGGTVVLVLT